MPSMPKSEVLSSLAKWEKPAQGTRFVYAPFLFITLAFGLSIAALVSCRFVIYEEDPDDPTAELVYRTAGVYCYEASLKEFVQNIFLGSIHTFVQVIGTGTAVLGAFATFLVWKGIKKAHGKCMYKTLGCLVICCVPGQFMTLSLLQSDFCWNYKGLENNCSLGWGGNCSIASGCLYFMGCIALCCVPQPVEVDDEPAEPSASASAKEEPEMAKAVVGDDDDDDEEAPPASEEK